MRPRNERKPAGPAIGSLYGSAIDVKTTQLDVGVNIINNSEPNTYFQIEMFFGAIESDMGTNVLNPGFKGQKYLRFRLNRLGSRSGRRSFAQRIERTIAPLLENKGVDDAVYTDSYVCGSPAMSFYVLSYPCYVDTTFEFDAAELAEAITGVKPGVDFPIDTDGFMYQYSLIGSGDLVSMKVVRQ